MTETELNAQNNKYIKQTIFFTRIAIFFNCLTILILVVGVFI